MMISLETYLRRGRSKLRGWLSDARVRLWLREVLFAAAGFLLSAAALFHGALPLSMGLVLGCSGWSAVLVSAGSSLGYLHFWGSAGYSGILWVVGALLITLLITDRPVAREAPLLPAALAGMVVSGVGVLLQFFMGDETPVHLYVIRVVLAMGTGWLFPRVLRQRSPVLEWISCGLCVLALAQVEPVLWMNFGIMAGGLLAARFSMMWVTAASLVLAGAGYLLGDIPVFGLLALLCFNMTMPLTLYTLVRRFPKNPGAVFGLLTFGLFLGFLPTAYGLELPLSGSLGCLISLGLLLPVAKAVDRN
jgi:hypothetical protein